MTKPMNKHDDIQTTSLGFWLYLMTDCLLFASLFATFAVLRGATAGGPSAQDIVDMNYVLIQTMALLFSSLTAGLALLTVRRNHTMQALSWLGATIMLGGVFLVMEINEFSTLISEGHTWEISAFLSAFFTLVGTHGIHITFGLIWAIILGILLIRGGIGHSLTKKMTIFTLFWHFLDIIWIFIFTFVYALGSVRL